MGASEERKIIYRKSNQLQEIMFTEVQINSFFEAGFLPDKVKANIKALDKAPNVMATADFVELLCTHANEGTVQALAELVEPIHDGLTDELLAELMLLQGRLPIDEPTADEMATLSHREYGASRKLGPVDQRALRELLTERVVVRRAASKQQLERARCLLHEQGSQSEQRDEQLRRMAVRLSEYLRAHNIQQTLFPDPVSRRTSTGTEEPTEELPERNPYSDVWSTLEDAFSHVRRTLTQVERLRDEKRRLFAVLGESKQHAHLEKEPAHSVVKRVLEKPALDLRTQETKLRIVEDLLSDLQLQLAKTKRERPGKVASKVDTDERAREKLRETEDKVRYLEDNERKLRSELEELQQRIGACQKNLGFVARSRTVKLIRRREHEKTKSRFDMASVVQAMTKAEAEAAGNLPTSAAAYPKFSRGSRSGRPRTRSEGNRDLDWSFEESDFSKADAD